MEGLRECHAVCNSTTRANLLGSTTLDSSMKKNAAAIRKMKTLHEGNADQVMKEISMVNQSKVCRCCLLVIFVLKRSVLLHVSLADSQHVSCMHVVYK